MIEWYFQSKQSNIPDVSPNVMPVLLKNFTMACTNKHTGLTIHVSSFAFWETDLSVLLCFQFSKMEFSGKFYVVTVEIEIVVCV